MKSTSMLSAVLALAFAMPATAADKGGSDPSSRMHDDMKKGARESMSMKPSGDIDYDFVTMMRKHHQMGIRMAEHETKNGKNPEVRALAEKIMKSQQEDTKELDRLAKQTGGASGKQKDKTSK